MKKELRENVALFFRRKRKIFVISLTNALFKSIIKEKLFVALIRKINYVRIT